MYVLLKWICPSMTEIKRFTKDIAVITSVWRSYINVTCIFTILNILVGLYTVLCNNEVQNIAEDSTSLVFIFILSMMCVVADNLIIFCRSSKMGNCKKKRLFAHKSSAILSSFQTLILTFSNSTFYNHEINRLHIRVTSEYLSTTFIGISY